MPTQRHTLRGELLLIIVIFLNSFGVVLMLEAGFGISAISSVPYAFSVVLPQVSLGLWTTLFQVLLVLSLMILRRRFVAQYLLSFVVGAAFGGMLDVYDLLLAGLPQGLGYRLVYFIASYIIICFGIALSNRCQMPIIPTDLWPRECAAIVNMPYSRIKIPFDVACVIVTGVMTLVFVHRLDGIGIGTIVAAFTMGRVIQAFESVFDRYFQVVSCMAR